MVSRIVDRREAITQAFQYAQRGDVIVLAGKGHETTQTIGNEVVSFDDREVALEMLRRTSC
jgi:UDP-N-acetylmuramoyl-L-alanyl-D-glutamate--2,6-diaminopimelate ligase